MPYAPYNHLLANRDSRLGMHWNLWLFQFVDDFRRDPVPSAIPDYEISWPSPREAALFHGVCSALLDEIGVPEESWPQWLTISRWLPDPWFVAGVESLKASAILESPVWFRRNNIWVMDNFLNRV